MKVTLTCTCVHMIQLVVEYVAAINDLLDEVQREVKIVVGSFKSDS